MCYLCKLQSDDVSETPPHNCSFYIPEVLRADLPRMLDDSALKSLPATLLAQYGTSIAPLTTTGDGNCQLHAISRACWGTEKYFRLLKTALCDELREHMDWYVGDESAEADERHRPPRAEWEKALETGMRPNAWLDLLHVFALANVLKRPIVVYGSDEDMERYGCHIQGCGGLFVPSRHPPGECCKRPVYISWVERAHYVPIVTVEWERAEFQRLPGCSPMHLSADTSFDDYVDLNAEAVPPPLIDQIERKTFLIHIGDLDSGAKELRVTPRDDVYAVAKQFQEKHGLPLTVIPVIVNHIRRRFISKNPETRFPLMLPLADPIASSPYVPARACQGLLKVTDKWASQVMGGVRSLLKRNATEHSFSDADVAALEALVRGMTGDSPSFDADRYQLLRRFLSGSPKIMSPLFDVVRVAVTVPEVAAAYAEMDGAALSSLLERRCTGGAGAELSTATLTNITHVVSHMCASAPFAACVRTNAHSFLDTLTSIFNEASARSDTRDLTLRFLTTNALLNFTVIVSPAEHSVARVILLQTLSVLSTMLQGVVDHKDQQAAWMGEYYHRGAANVVKAIGTVVFHREDLRRVCHLLRGFVPLLDAAGELGNADLAWSCNHVRAMLTTE